MKLKQDKIANNSAPPELSQAYLETLKEIKDKVQTSQIKAAVKVNQELVQLYWEIGTVISQRQKKEGWGAKTIDRLGKDLRSMFPKMKGFSPRNLKYMLRFSLEYPKKEIVQQLVAQIPVCRAWPTSWGWKSPIQPDGGEGLVNHKGLVVRLGLKEVGIKFAS